MSIKNQKKLSLILSIVLVLTVIAAIFIRFSRAWFASDTDPVIYSDDLYIVSSEGLSMQLESQDETDASIHEVINLKDVMGDNDDYLMLSQVSSSNGIEFFSREEDEDGLVMYKEVDEGDGYVEVTIRLYNSSDTTTLDREVYLSDVQFNFIDSNNNIITNNNCTEDALRISLEIEDYQEIKSTYIMALDRAVNAFDRKDLFKDDNNNDYASTIIEKVASANYYINHYAVYQDGVSTESTSAAIQKAIEDGLIKYATEAKECRSNQTVYYTSAFMKYINGNLNSNCIILTRIPSGESSKVTFRLWLEGSDPRCDVPIAGSKFNFVIKFANETVSN